jgi:hypothetical protein
VARFWWREAVCAEIGTDLFFADGPGRIPGAAFRACRELCPVREQCLAAELSHEHQADGVFGGFGVDAREVLRRRVDRGQDPIWVAKVAIARETVLRRAS